MPHIILCDPRARTEALKRDPIVIIKAGKGYPVGILNHNQPLLDVDLDALL